MKFYKLNLRVSEFQKQDITLTKNKFFVTLYQNPSFLLKNLHFPSLNSEFVELQYL